MQTEVISKDLHGNDIKLVVRKPSPKNYRDSELIYNKTVREALANGAMLRQKLNNYLIEQEIWSETKEKQYKVILDNIARSEESLKVGGIKLGQAKQVALELRSLRDELRGLVQEKQNYDTMTAEGQGDNARFNYLVAVCTFKEDGKTPLWATVKEYDESYEPYAVEAASALAKMIYDLDPDYDNKLPENQFLKKYKFVNEEFKLVNKDGHLVDEDGRLINTEGRLVAYREDGTQYFVNRNGEEISESGEKLIKSLPFLDDDGNPILEESTTENTEIV